MLGAYFFDFEFISEEVKKSVELNSKTSKML